MRILSLFRRLAAMGIVAMAATNSFAQEVYPGDGQVAISATNVSEMLRRIEVLEAAIGNDVAKATKGDGYGEWQDTHGEGWSHQIGGRIMGDYVMYADQNGGSIAEAGDVDNYFEFRRLRLFVAGEGYGVYDYKLEVDFEPENAFDVTTMVTPGPPPVIQEDTINTSGVAITDVYFGIHEIPVFGYVRFGHYKAPFSLEELTSSRFITFMERSLTNVFSPAREVGVTAYQTSQDRNATVAMGVFFDDIDPVAKERLDDNQGTLLAMRATYLPIYDEPSDGRYLVHTGLGFQYTNNQDDQMRFRSRPEVHEGPAFIDSGTLAGSSFYTVNPEFAWVNGPLSVQAEYMYTQAQTAALGDLDFHGAYVYGSYFLTGESRAYDRSGGYFTRVRPFENFWIIPGCVGSGAWELAARWSYLDLSGTGDDLAGEQNNYALGVNWYWNPHVRWMFNYIHSESDYDNGDPDAENDIMAFRGQVDF